MTTRKRVRIATGIYQDQYGRAATVKVGGVQREQRFPLDEPIDRMQAWQVRTRADLTEDRDGRELPTKNWKGLKPSPDGWCYVYFVRTGSRVKIGRATNPTQRFRGLQTAHPRALSLVLAIPAHATLEAAIHARFKHLHERGEWFRLAPDLVAFILALEQGANPIALLWEPA